METARAQLVARLVIFISLLLLSTVGETAGSDFNYNEAVDLYQQVISGKRRLEDLSPEDQSKVLIIYQMINRSSCDDQPEECCDARREVDDTAQELSNYATRLQRCASSQDYSDDCSSEFRRTKNAYFEYESAVSNVASYCD